MKIFLQTALNDEYFQDWLQILLECERNGYVLPRRFAVRAFQLFDIITDAEIEEDLLKNLDWYMSFEHSLPRTALIDTLKYYGHIHKIRLVSQ